MPYMTRDPRWMRHESELKSWEAEGGALEGRAPWVPLTDEDVDFLRSMFSEMLERRGFYVPKFPKFFISDIPAHVFGADGEAVPLE